MKIFQRIYTIGIPGTLWPCMACVPKSRAFHTLLLVTLLLFVQNIAVAISVDTRCPMPVARELQPLVHASSLPFVFSNIEHRASNIDFHGILAFATTEEIIRDGLPVLILVTLIILFILAVNTFGKRENYLEAQVKDRTRQINLKNQQILQQAEDLNMEKDKVDRVNTELMTMLNKLEATIEKMNDQKDVIEESNRKMLDSIRYAKRIQKAILPPHENMQELIPESFIFYQAKDIVSGDFYFSTKKMGRSFLAAVDCTGHGVPGAFMSLIAHNQLTRAINEYGILEPSRILHWAEKGLSQILSRGNEGGENGDGMELSLIAFDPKRNVIEYAGAHRPLYRIHKGELIEYKGEPFSIGPVQQAFDVEKRFTNHVIELVEGDMFYIFSDGFVSQFNATTGKKYMTGRFKQFLLTIAHLPAAEQKERMSQEYESWRGESAQVDDLLVIGFRVKGIEKKDVPVAVVISAEIELK